MPLSIRKMTQAVDTWQEKGISPCRLVRGFWPGKQPPLRLIDLLWPPDAVKLHPGSDKPDTYVHNRPRDAVARHFDAKQVNGRTAA